NRRPHHRASRKPNRPSRPLRRPQRLARPSAGPPRPNPRQSLPPNPRPVPPRSANRPPSRPGPVAPGRRWKNLRDNETPHIARTRSALVSPRQMLRTLIDSQERAMPGKNGAIKLVAGNSNPKLAEAIASYLATPLAAAVVRRFADMEIFVEIQENV